ncbi:MAG: Exodeoxyribonuclease 7 small subunit [Chlamydiae bacterium]|nr:Exodeoxyribonuclease 7 small subunit [Chlamydiota bacterium]
MSEQTPLNFEQSFARLEEILDKMNSGNVSLDESLTLYEEADRLMIKCHEKLSNAQTKIETLIKNRSGELAKKEEPDRAPFDVEEVS